MMIIVWRVFLSASIVRSMEVLPMSNALTHTKTKTVLLRYWIHWRYSTYYLHLQAFLDVCIHRL
jgi:hypothetical protein